MTDPCYAVPCLQSLREIVKGPQVRALLSPSCCPNSVSGSRSCHLQNGWTPGEDRQLRNCTCNSVLALSLAATAPPPPQGCTRTQHLPMVPSTGVWQLQVTAGLSASPPSLTLPAPPANSPSFH